jgi:L-iditol 2-dehydrogenase
MKALVLQNYNEFIYKDVPNPVIKDNEVLISVKAVGICGSDVHGMDGSTGRRIPPLIMGHEASGEIVEVGSKVTKWSIRDRVTFDSTIYPLNDWYTLKGFYNLSNNRQVLGVSTSEYKRNGAFAEYIAVPEHILYKIPNKVSFEEAAMVEPVAVAAHALSLSNTELNNNILVVGSGMIGSLLINLLKLSGAGKIIAVDTDNQKSEMAKKYGADYFINPQINNLKDIVSGLTYGRGVDQSYEAVGNNAAINIAILNTRRGGAVTLIGNVSPNVEIPLQHVVTNQIRLQGSCAICGEYETVLSLMENQKIDVKPLISKIAPLDQGAEWLKRLYNKEKGLNKVILVP